MSGSCPQLLDSASSTTQAPWTDHERQILLDTLRILIQRSLGPEGRRVRSLGRGNYSLDAGSGIGFVKRLYTASALAISFLRFGFSRSYCISSLILSLTAAGR